MSDLHLEFYPDSGHAFIDSLDTSGVDALVLAGDTGVCNLLPDIMPRFCDRYPEVLCLYGNHELYHSSFEAVRQVLHTLMAQKSNFHLLDNDVLILKGQRFIGTTLWFPFQEDNEFHESDLNDFQCIGNFRKRVYHENKMARGFIDRMVRPGDVVITHHLPSLRSIPRRFREAPGSRFKFCPMDHLIEERDIRLWIHGHIHRSLDYRLKGTRVICNPFGYRQIAENPKFNYRCIVEVPGDGLQ